MPNLLSVLVVMSAAAPRDATKSFALRLLDVRNCGYLLIRKKVNDFDRAPREQVRRVYIQRGRVHGP